jgi:hypothetical protein
VDSVKVADWLLLRRHGWRRMHKGHFHRKGWWWCEGWSWMPKEDALVLARAWEDKERRALAAKVTLSYQIVGDLEDELAAARKMLAEDERAAASAEITRGRP